ncbi:hypothetical protein ABBQ32_013968 [Trebouxia sp. C0010 RCD-2024]
MMTYSVAPHMNPTAADALRKTQKHDNPSLQGKSVELAGSGVTSVFPTRLDHNVGNKRGPNWLAGFLYWLRRKERGWSPDRGSAQHQRERALRQSPALVATGRHAGQSRVEYVQKHYLFLHAWKRDFFHAAIHTPLYLVLAVIAVIYTTTFFFFGLLWWSILRCHGDCVANNNGDTGFVTALIFSVVTEQTIGYGNTYPNECWAAAWLIMVQSVLGMIMDAITIGIVFARISHPKQRGRTIAISDSAVISRRDGILKFMFRIADIRRTQVIQPQVKAYLYTWGEGRNTAEGEHIPVRIESLEIGYIDGQLLLPLIEEHTIDERSPLCGHTYMSLKSVNAEIVVTFEGTTEFGNPFMARQSYLMDEIMWGHQFTQIIHPPETDDTKYRIDFSRFHDTLPQEGLDELKSQEDRCMRVLRPDVTTVPYPLLGENTLVISDSLVLSPGPGGKPQLQVRIGDTYPNQHVEITVRIYIYRWITTDVSGIPQDYSVEQLEVGYETGADRLLLWLPMVVTHVIDDTSPLANWRDLDTVLNDSDATIVVVVEGYMYSMGTNRMRMRMFHTQSDVHPNHIFCPVVTAPSSSADYKPRVDWSKFHEVIALEQEELQSPHLQHVSRAWGALSNSYRPALLGAEDDSLDATVTYKPGQLSSIMANPELVKQLSRQTNEMSFRGSRAPEAGHIHLTPDTDPENTFRTRQRNSRPRVRFEELFAPEDSSHHGEQPQNGSTGQQIPEQV